MAKGEFSEVNKTVHKQDRNKIRKSLQTLQPSTEKSADKMLIGNNVVHPDKILPYEKKVSKTVQKVVVADKENAPTLRRSKRKTDMKDTDSPVEPKTSKFSAKRIFSLKTKPKKNASKSKRHSVTVKSEQKTNLNEAKLSFSPAAQVLNKNSDVSESVNPDTNVLIASSSEVTDDSGFESSSRISDQGQTSDIKSSSTAPYDYDVSILTCDNPPLSYWKDLAEQRRINLKKALHENELLRDELTVLETENSQLKQLVKEAEEFAQVVEGVIS